MRKKTIVIFRSVGKIANNELEKLCGLCEAKAISERVKWWQDGKKELKKRNDS